MGIDEKVMATKALRWIANAMIVLIVAAILAVGIPKLLGIRSFAVLSGSMTPSIGVGALVFAQPTAFEDIHEGDVITFVLNEDFDVVTHRVVSIDEADQTFVTQGDANDVPDENPVWYPNVVGVVHLTFPQAGYVLNWFSTLSNKIIAVTVVAVLLIFALIVDIVLRPSRARHGKASDHPARESGDS